MLTSLLLCALVKSQSLQSVSGFFRIERECKPFAKVHDCGCAFKVTPRYFLDDGMGTSREIDLDAERVASYGGPQRMAGQWVTAECEPETGTGHLRMRRFGVLTPGTLQSAIDRGDSSVYADVPLLARRAILRGPIRLGAKGARLETGSKPYLTILCRTSDTTGVTPRPASDYTANMKSTFPGFDHYVRNMSYGAWNVAGSTTVGWINLPKAKAAYLTPRDVDGKPTWDHQKLMPDIIAQLDPTVDFSKYWGINVFMNTGDDWGGAYATSYFVTADGLNGWMPITEDNGGFSQNVLGHEDGHNFGFDHSSGPYNDPYDSQWDVMSSGAHTEQDPTLGAVWVSNGYNAFHRYKNGWIALNRVAFGLPGDNRTVHLERLTDPSNASDPLMAKVYIGGSARHYYTVEARKPLGYDKSLPSCVVIHDVVESRSVSDPSSVAPRFDRAAQVVDPDNNGNPNDAAAQWTPGETYQDAANGIRIQVVSEDATGFNVRIAVDANQPAPGVVTNGKDDGAGSLRDWFWYRQDFPTAALTFRIPTSDPSYVPGKGFFRIRLKTALPEIATAGAAIDGATQTAFTGDTNPNGPEIMLDGADAGEYAHGLVLKGANQTVRNLAIGNFKASGLRVDGATSASVQNCVIGLEPDGTTAAPNAWEGIAVLGGSQGAQIGGLGAGNLVSGNTGYGISVWDLGTRDTKIYGNRVGSDATGTLARPNGYDGISLNRDSSATTVGAAATGMGNLVSGGASNGIGVYSVNGTRIVGNRIGTNAAGSAALDNRYWGVAVRGTSADTVVSGNLVGGCDAGIGAGDAGVRNLTIEGNLAGVDATGTKKIGNRYQGIYVFGGAQKVTIRNNLASGNAGDGIAVTNAGTKDVLVEGNKAGTDGTGRVALPNAYNGVWVGDGASATLRNNLLSGNGYSGIVLSKAAESVVEANLVGLDVGGTLALPNAGTGVYINAGTTNCRVGGAAGLENAIAGNGVEGLVLADAGTTGNHVSGNFVGVNRAGTALGNKANGVWVGNGAQGNWIGDPSASNVIAGNALCGVVIGQAGTSGNRVQNSWIGALPNGLARPNGQEGVLLWGGATGNAIGGTGPGEANTIASNLRNGVSVNDAATAGNSIRGNRILDNAFLGIQLAGNDGPAGVTANDGLDADAGPNGLQNFPVLATAARSGGGIGVTGTFSGAANRTLTLDFYGVGAADPSGYGEGEEWLGSQQVTTNASGVASFTATIPDTGLSKLTATATAPTGETGEFSGAIPITGTSPLRLDSLAVAPTSVRGGTMATGILKMTAASSGPVAVALSSSNPAVATVPASVAASSTGATTDFSVATKPVAQATTVTLSATYLGVTRTATLTVTPPALSGLTVTPLRALGGTKFTGTLSLDAPAPAGGMSVAMEVDKPSAATAPPTVTVGAGETTAPVTLDSRVVPVDTLVTAKATLGGISATAPFTVAAKATGLSTLTFDPSSVMGGTGSTGKLALSGPAPAGGFVVGLASDKPEVTVPPSVTIPEGASTATFPVGTAPVGANVVATVVASIPESGSVSGQLEVTPLKVVGLTMNPDAVAGGTSSTGTVTLNAAAPADTAVALASDALEAAVPATVVVPKGERTAVFTALTTGVPVTKTATISGSLNGASASGTLRIVASEITSFTVAPNVLHGGQSAVGRVTIVGSSAGAVVALSSSDPAVRVPASVTVPVDALEASFGVDTSGVDDNTVVTLSATLNGKTITQTVTVLRSTLVGLEFSPSTTIGGNASTGKLTMDGPAGPGGLRVALVCASTSAKVPASVTIPAGAASATFAVATTPVTATTVAVVTASGPSVVLRANLTVVGASPLTMTLSPASLVGGKGLKGTVTLSAKAPPQGVTITFAGSDPALRMPTSLVIKSGKISGSFSAATLPVGADRVAVGAAGANGIVARASVTILAPRLKSFSVSPKKVTGGQSATGKVTISSAAPAEGLRITLASSTPAASVPTTMTIPAGKTSGTFAVATRPVPDDVAATLSASLNGASLSGGLTIAAPVLKSVSVAPNKVKGGLLLAGTVKIGSPAPEGGFTVALSSSSPACDGGSVTIPGGAVSGSFALATHPVVADAKVTITAKRGAKSVKTSATVQKP